MHRVKLSSKMIEIDRPNKKIRLLKEVSDWLKDHGIKYNLRYDYNSPRPDEVDKTSYLIQGIGYALTFTNEKDVIMFKLRWL